MTNKKKKLPLNGKCNKILNITNFFWISKERKNNRDMPQELSTQCYYRVRTLT